MSTKHCRVRQLETCSREMFGDLVLFTHPHHHHPIMHSMPISPLIQMSSSSQKQKVSDLVEQLLGEIYNNTDGVSTISSISFSGRSSRRSSFHVGDLKGKGKEDLKLLINYLDDNIEHTGNTLVKQLKRRDALRRQQDAHCDVITTHLQKRAVSSETDMRFTIQPLYVPTTESGYGQWVAAMKMVAQLPGGIPPEFRRRLWLILADRHLNAKHINWATVERNCFSEWSHPADSELGVQIVKDLHRTGCSLFCGEDGQENQALLKRVLLAYARWNKAVGYCQGFNMLAALILQVTDKCETDALKLMIYLIEGVLPECYFADSLRGLSVDMAVFRELLRTRLPKLSKHLDTLQNAAKEGGNSSYEPPLTNVFTMQWFLTLFCNCLPQPTVLRIWDLILLEGNEILLRTALAIWQFLAERIQNVRSADEFYGIMGVLMRELLEFGLLDGNSLIKAVVTIGPLTELPSLREHYLYNINPWGSTTPKANAFSNENKQLKVYPKERLVLDISALKKQYLKLKQRQRQAHIIFSAAISRHQSPTSAPIAMNHLLLGKSALMPAKRLGGPPKGSVPPARHQSPKTLLWKDALKNTSSSSSSSDTELCDDPSESSSDSEDLPEASDKPISDKDNINKIPVGNIRNELESDDDSVDFEQFLEDRVRCLNEEETKEENHTKMSRRSSELALQIIQENSVILHRIMQCQSRLSPSPPPIDDNSIEPQENPVKFLPVLCKDESDMLSGNAWIDTETCFPTESSSLPKHTLDKSPEYGSRYLSILEKSRNLDEKYNNLILNASIKPNIEARAGNLNELTYGNEGKLHSDIEFKNITPKNKFNLPIKQFCDAAIEEQDEVTPKVDFPKFSENLDMNCKLFSSFYENKHLTQSEENSFKTSPTLDLNVSMEECNLFSKPIKELNSSKDLFVPLTKQISMNLEAFERYTKEQTSPEIDTSRFFINSFKKETEETKSVDLQNSPKFFENQKSTTEETKSLIKDFTSSLKDDFVSKEEKENTSPTIDFYRSFLNQKTCKEETVDATLTEHSLLQQIENSFSSTMDFSKYSKQDFTTSTLKQLPEKNTSQKLDQTDFNSLNKEHFDYYKSIKNIQSPNFGSLEDTNLPSSSKSTNSETFEENQKIVTDFPSDISLMDSFKKVSNLESFREGSKENTSPVDSSKPFKDQMVLNLTPFEENTNFSVNEDKSPTNIGGLSPSNRTYDPFPVSRSPRRDKEIALKLGLYKK